MVGEEEAKIVEFMAICSAILESRFGTHRLRAEGGSLVLIVGTKYASAGIPDITDAPRQARAIARELEGGLTG